jgi:peptidoglycan/LPS O-acetylase OafA/YrhL
MTATDNLLALEREGVSARIYLEPLTGLRGIAATWVTLWHIWGFAGKPQYHLELVQYNLDLTPFIRIGWSGVDIFFVLSGFVLGLAWCQAWLGNRPPIRIGEYFRRRLLRVLPALWAQILVLSLLFTALGLALPPVSELLSQGLLAHNLFGSQEHQLNPVYWTLPVEFDYYLLLPLLALLVSPPRWPILLLAGMGLVGLYRYTLFHGLPADTTIGQKVWLLNQLPGRIDQFLAGMVAAWLYSHSRQLGFRTTRIYRWRTHLLTAGILGFAAMAWFIHNIQPIGANNQAGLTYWGGHWSLFAWHSGTGLFIAMIVLAAALGTRATNWLLANRAMLFLGVISYSLYLWHFPVVKWLHGLQLPRLFENEPFISALLWAALPVIAVSALSYQAVERPFLRLRHSGK